MAEVFIRVNATHPAIKDAFLHNNSTLATAVFWSSPLS